MLRTFALVFVTLPLAAQPFGVQVKAGIPVADFSQSEYLVRNGSSTAWTNRYVIGASAEFRMPRRFSVEVDVLYERIHLTGYVQQVPVPDTDNLNATGSAWQFPVLAKYRFAKGPVAPFVSAGPSVRLMRFSGELQTTTLLPTRVTRTMGLDESHGKIGLAAGAGIDVSLGGVRLSPEIRYTYYGGEIECATCGTVQPLRGLNSAAIFLGIGF